MSKVGIIGSSGFIGKALNDKLKTKYLYNSRNINKIKKISFDELYCCAPSSLIWKANKNPGKDLKNIVKLCLNLTGLKVKKFILISSIEVYQRQSVCNEFSAKNEIGSSYGSNRLFFENFVTKNFKKSIIVRLPVVYGIGLKKNLIFDLIHQKRTHLINKNDKLQFFPSAKILKFINKIKNKNISPINFASEPVKVKDLLDTLGREDILINKINTKPRIYNMKSKKLMLINKKDYIFSKSEILKSIKNFYKNEIRNKQFILEKK